MQHDTQRSSIVIAREIDLKRVLVMIRNGAKGLRYTIAPELVDRLLAALESLAEVHDLRISIRYRTASEERVLYFAAGGAVAGALVGGAIGGPAGAAIGAVAGAAAGALASHVELTLVSGAGSSPSTLVIA